MNIYKNKKTGATIETMCVVHGGNWEKVTPKKSKKEAAKDVKQDNNNMKQDDTPPQGGDGGDE